MTNRQIWKEEINEHDLSDIRLDRLAQLIDIMRRVRDEDRAFDMHYWQYQGQRLQHKIKTTEESLHACGTTACMAGWLAVSPEFKATGGNVDCNGAPTYIHGARGYVDRGDSVFEFLTGKEMEPMDNIGRYLAFCDSELNPHDIIDRLEYIRSELAA